MLVALRLLTLRLHLRKQIGLGNSDRPVLNFVPLPVQVLNRCRTTEGSFPLEVAS